MSSLLNIIEYALYLLLAFAAFSLIYRRYVEHKCRAEGAAFAHEWLKTRTPRERLFMPTDLWKHCPYNNATNSGYLKMVAWRRGFENVFWCGEN